MKMKFVSPKAIARAVGKAIALLYVSLVLMLLAVVAAIPFTSGGLLFVTAWAVLPIVLIFTTFTGLYIQYRLTCGGTNETD
jgi:hypothetical protein